MYEDLTAHTQSFDAISKPIIVDVHFASKDGELQTLEGIVKYKKGDAIIKGVEGEQWPISFSHFKTTYESGLLVPLGQNGRYTKRIKKVVALIINKTIDIELSDERGTLHGEPGDILVQYAPGDLAIIDSCIFNKTYQNCKQGKLHPNEY